VLFPKLQTIFIKKQTKKKKTLGQWCRCLSAGKDDEKQSDWIVPINIPLTSDFTQRTLSLVMRI